MTLIAGVFSRDASPIDETIVSALKNNLSRNASDRVELFQDSRVCLMKIDIGAFRAPGVHRDPRGGSVSFLTGEPLLKSTEHSVGGERDVDLEELHRGLDIGSLDALRSGTGIFSVAHYHASSGTLMLATDKIGHRAIYYRIDPQKVVFASVLRVLEALPLPKTMDVLSLAEMNIYPRHTLGDRTAYREIKRLRSAEVLTLCGHNVSSRLYFDFGAVPQVSDGDEEKLLRDSHERFMSAVRRRLRSDRVVASCLSGGLDSRAVVSALRTLDARVYTVNMYQFYNSQDRVYAAMFSEAAGTVHTEVEVPDWISGQTFERTAMDAWEAALARSGENQENRQLLWTGDGGSVSSGHLHIEQELADLLRQGRMRDAFNSYHLQGLNRRMLTPLAPQLDEAMFEAFLEEMNSIGSPDPARAFHVFLIKNHQRKDFVQHFEYIDLHRTEFQCPLYDSDYLESIVRLPFDWTVAHRFYHKWMQLFPPFATAVPWQTYKGHEPCPLPAAPGVATQWDPQTVRVTTKARKQKLLNRALNALRAKSFPTPLVNRRALAVATMLHALELRDCQSGISVAANFCDYWNRCNGAYSLPDKIDEAGSDIDDIGTNTAKGSLEQKFAKVGGSAD